MNSFHYVWIKNLPRLLKKFKVLQESFPEKSQKAELKISLQSVESCNHAFGLHSDDLQHHNLQQPKESNSRSENCSKDVSIQRNSDIPDSVLLRKKKKQKSKEPVKSSRTTFDVFSEVLHRSKGSCPHEENEQNCIHLEIETNENDNLNYSSLTDLSDINLYTNLINEESSRCRKNEIDYANWDNPNQLVDRLRILVAEPAAENYRYTNEIYTIIRELKKAEYIY